MFLVILGYYEVLNTEKEAVMTVTEMDIPNCQN